MEFNLSSGTTVIFRDDKVEINREGGKAAMKGLFAGRAMGKMYIKAKSITGAILYADMLIILGSGLPGVKEFNLSKISDIKQLPNTITGKAEELNPIYEEIMSLNV